MDERRPGFLTGRLTYLAWQIHQALEDLMAQLSRRRRPRRPSHGDVLDLLHCVVQKLDRMEDKLSALDDAVSGLTSEVNRVLDEVVDDLRTKLSQAQADDASAAEMASDVEENITKLSELRDRVAGYPGEQVVEGEEGNLPVEPTEGQPTA